MTRILYSDDRNAVCFLLVHVQDIVCMLYTLFALHIHMHTGPRSDIDIDPSRRLLAIGMSRNIHAVERSKLCTSMRSRRSSV